jgi:tellurite resistance protein TehA-like permease
MDASRTSIGLFILPAVLIAALIGDGAHSATRVDFTIGLVFELFALWTLFLAVRQLLRSLRGISRS